MPDDAEHLQQVLLISLLHCLSEVRVEYLEWEYFVTGQ